MFRFSALAICLMFFGSAPILADTGKTPKVPKELLEKRAEAAGKVWKEKFLRLRNREARPSDLFGWSERWLEAELALRHDAADRAKALKGHLARTKDVERVAVQSARTGQGMQSDADAATYYRLEAEIRLIKEGVDPNSSTGDKEKPEIK